MSEIFKDFDDRIERITSKRAKLRDGYVGRVNKDGLVVFRPKRRAISVSPRGIAMVLIAFIFFKALIMSHLGINIYLERIDKLHSGTIVEQAGAFIMQPDPATLWVAGKIRPYIQ